MIRRRLSMNIGFVTNSSFAVHHFPREVLEDPAVKAFVEAYEISQGFVGEALTYRSRCGTVAMTKEQKQQVYDEFHRKEHDFFVPPHVDTESDNILVIYGDEHMSMARELSHLMDEAAKKMGLKVLSGDYH